MLRDMSIIYAVDCRRKGENAQQVIDLTAAARRDAEELAARQQEVERLQAELLGTGQDLQAVQSQMAELEQTSQLLKDEYQVQGFLFVLWSSLLWHGRPCSWL